MAAIELKCLAIVSLINCNISNGHYLNMCVVSVRSKLGSLHAFKHSPQTTVLKLAFAKVIELTVLPLIVLQLIVLKKHSKKAC